MIEIDVTQSLRDLLNLEPGMKAAIRAGAVHLEGWIKRYPPASEGNRPGRRNAKGYLMPWYIRGTGTAYQSGAVRKTSQRLMQKWTIRERDGGWSAVIGNNVTYAPFVHSEENQAWFHKARGWRTDQEAIDSQGDIVTTMIDEAIQAHIERYGGK